jgi:hypothetical protein
MVEAIMMFALLAGCLILIFFGLLSIYRIPRILWAMLLRSLA